MQFWNQFWPAFAANLVAGVVVLLIVYAFLQWYRHPSLTVEAIPRGGAPGRFEFEVMLRNRGKLNFAANEIYWHVFTDSRIEILEATQNAESDHSEISGTLMKHFRGAIDGPLFPNRPWGCLRLWVNTPEQGAFKLHYFISTAHGQFPKYLRKLKDGEARLRSLPCFAEVTANGIVQREQ